MRIVIVGAGIAGQAHALTAIEAGHEVTLLERQSRPLGASVRNFGTIWPIGCVPGPEREQALRGVERWKQISHDLGFWTRPYGSLSLAYREEAWAILNEFAAGTAGDGSSMEGPDASFTLLDAATTQERFPAVNPSGLKGALLSHAEMVVPPADGVAALSNHLTDRGAQVHFGTVAVRVLEGSVETSDGRQFPFDHLVVAAGEDMRTLFPLELAAASVSPCKLQMMRTVPQPGSFDLGPICVSDLTLCHYPAFRDCASTPRLRERLEAERPELLQAGVHVIAAQHDDGSVVLGDTHEYAEDFSPDLRNDLEEMVLTELGRFVCLPSSRIATRWSGVYLKSVVGQTQVILHPRSNVTLVAALGGLGMTLSWGLAERNIARLEEVPA